MDQVRTNSGDFPSCKRGKQLKQAPQGKHHRVSAPRSMTKILVVCRPMLPEISLMYTLAKRGK